MHQRPWREHGAALMRACRAGDAAAELEARRNLAAGRLEEKITEILGAAPPLSSEQCDRLSALLRGAA